MKKLALLATAALIGGASAEAPACAANGFYAGVNLGLANTNVKYNWVVENTTAPKVQNTAIDAGKLSMQYGLFGGYNMGLCNSVVVGVELFVGGDSSKVKTLDDAASGAYISLGKAQVKRTMYYGLAPRIGYMITPNVLAYIRLGVEGGKWKAEYFPNADAVDANKGATTPTELAAAKATKTASKNRVNFTPGVGLDVFASKNVFVRAQYHYVFGPKMTLNYDISKLANGNQFNGTNMKQSFKVSQHVISLAVGYKF